MMGWTRRIAPVAARMMTWEVTTAFDGTLTETELQKRFDEDCRNAFGANPVDGKCAKNRVFFWPLVSFNASDGRKHRYLVSIANEPLECYRKKIDCCLPRQIALYAIADKILRGGWNGVECSKCDDMCAGHAEDCAENGNLMLVALWKSVLYILVFAKGRLCHWSEEFGYGDCIDERCRNRVKRFKSFLKTDELFASSGLFGEICICCDETWNMKTLFQLGAKDPFWNGLDLDECQSMKPCEKRRWSMCALMLLSLGLLLAMFFGRSVVMHPNKDIPAVELSSPAARDLELLAWAEGHRDLLPAKWNLGRASVAYDEMSGSRRTSRSACDSLECKLLGIVGGRVALMKTAMGETKTLSVGDSLLSYRVKEIGGNEVVLRCGRKEVRYEIESPKVSSIVTVGAR
ncbi:hypothetical protein [Fibrobacter sp. UWB12]|uniref:hypothetical protein n=1 Tax=Fibrobacter sp. UWB12 TaxID=1896203 RepID=UPI0009118F97|nr:hypothetical protein [Fibrobacter sp. UWB12]SHK19513.1 hypothetical protein SAMN05720759_10146 [Fibrobacter sp. UWB12]